MSRSLSIMLVIVGGMMFTSMTGCSTAPKAEDQASFMGRADASADWFTQNVPGLQIQIDNAEAYIIFPDVAQWGIIFAGGQFGRGALMESGLHTGWGAVNTGSIGLQAGVQGFRMLIVLQDEATLMDFKANKWTGSAQAVAVGGEAGGGATAPFSKGMAVYTGANSGLMAGVNIGLHYIHYKPLDAP